MSIFYFITGFFSAFRRPNIIIHEDELFLTKIDKEIKEGKQNVYFDKLSELKLT